MNIQESIQKHAEWKLKFRAAITKQESLDVTTISKDNCCVLGQWLHGEGKTKFGSKTEFQHVCARHVAFHTEAGKVAQLINAKRYVEAEKALENGTPYADASSSVGAALISLKRKIGA